MSDNGIKAEDEHLQDREEGGDDEVRPLPITLRPENCCRKFGAHSDVVRG